MENSQISIAFYNVENLFDAIDGPNTLDREFTPRGKKKWNPYRLNHKIQKLGRTIAEIGRDKSSIPPVLVGLAEVENKTVLHDLLKAEALKSTPYDFLHHESSDERGMDVALLYNKKIFQPSDIKSIPVFLYDAAKKRDHTRDILYVQGTLQGEQIHVFVNHWSSKRAGNANVGKHLQIVKTLEREIANIAAPDPKILLLGDFNENPSEQALQLLVAKNFNNPMEKLHAQGMGSSKFYGKWMLFDQILLSKNFFAPKAKQLQFQEAAIFNEPFLQNPKGPFKGEPFRTYSGKYYLGGYSDHFPVYVVLQKRTYSTL